MNAAETRIAKRVGAAAAVLLVWCAAFVLANQKEPRAVEQPPAAEQAAAASPAEGVTPASRTQHPAVSEDDRYFAEVMIYKGMGHESWVGILPGDRPVKLTETLGFDSGEFAGLFEGACDPTQVDPRYTNSKYLSSKCDVQRPGRELIDREQARTMLGG